MIWSICFFAALAVLVLCGVLLGLIRKGRIAASGAFRPFNILFAGVVVAAIIIFIPICSSHPHEGGFFVTLLLSLHNMLRLFVIDDWHIAEKTFTGLKTRTTYYARVRSYHEFEGFTYYGQWSNVLNAKTN